MFTIDSTCVIHCARPLAPFGGGNGLHGNEARQYLEGGIACIGMRLGKAWMGMGLDKTWRWEQLHVSEARQDLGKG